jgi:CRP-like cAMP-binding protein
MRNLDQVRVVLIDMTTKTRDPKQNLIHSLPLFSDRSRREVDLIASLSDVVDVPAGKVLMREGDRGREFFALVSGSAEVTRRGEHLADVAPGEFFGEIALVARMPRTATVTATADSQVLVMTDNDFRRLIDIDPDLRLRVLSRLAKRLEGLRL